MSKITDPKLDKLMFIVGWSCVGLMALVVLAALVFVGLGIAEHQGLIP